MTSFNFITVRPKGSLLTVIDSSNVPRYVCFTDKMNAMNCISYISNFRAEYGYYPVMDLSKKDKRVKIEAKLTSPKLKPTTIRRFFKIVTYDETYLDELCAKNNINMFCVHNFSYHTKENNVELLLSAQELNGKPDLLKYAENLDDIYYG